MRRRLHRQTCGKFDCEADIIIDEKIKKISEFKFNILKLNILKLNKNIKNLVLGYLRPSKEVFKNRINTLEIQMLIMMTNVKSIRRFVKNFNS